MNGSQALITSLVDAGVEVCFMNPGTSEMHFVHALDSVPRMRGVLALFEGVATGAADGYARVTGSPAAVLLHLGPGLGNGLANLHNARRARTPLLCVVARSFPCEADPDHRQSRERTGLRGLRIRRPSLASLRLLGRRRRRVRTVRRGRRGSCRR